MTATSLDLSQIKTDVLSSAATFRTLIGVDIASFATSAQGALADTALQPSDITSGTITAGTVNIDFDSLGASSPLTLTASTSTETPLVIKGAASQTGNLQEWQDSTGSTQLSVLNNGLIKRLNGTIDPNGSWSGPSAITVTASQVIIVTNATGGQIAFTYDNSGGKGVFVRNQSGNNSITLGGASGASPGPISVLGNAATGNANGGNLFIAAGAGAGTGVPGNLIISNLPASDPAVVGAVWSDSGTLKISAG